MPSLEEQNVIDREHRLPLVQSALNSLGAELFHLMGAQVLITGALGFFGRYVVESLLELNRRWCNGPLPPKPITVFALDSGAVAGGKSLINPWPNEPHLYFWQHDVRHSLRGILKDVYDKSLTHVWHLAGIASPYWYKRFPEETIAVAVDGTRNMLGLAEEHGAKFMFTSSSEVYQTAMQTPTPETYVGAIPSMNDRSCYDVSKLMAETLCYVAASKQNVHASVVRIFNSFGPGMSEQDRRILPRIASAMKGGRELQVYMPREPSAPAYSDGQPVMPTRTYTPVANTLSGFLKVALVGQRVPNGIYNVGLDTDELSVIGLLNLVREVTGVNVKAKLVPPPENYETEPLRRCPNVSKLRALGWEPCLSLRDGLESFFAWAGKSYTGES